MSGTSSGLQWRAQLLTHKLMRRAAGVPWQLFWDEVSHRRELAWDPPVIRQIGVDREADLVQIEVADRVYWFPSVVTPHMLEGLYKLTYYPVHPHHFEGPGCEIRPGDVVVDGGSFEGFFTRFALDRGASVIAVEPWTPMAEALRRNFAPEIESGRMQVVSVLLSDRVGRTRLVIDPAYPLAASVYNEPGEGLIAEDVPETTLDQLIESSPWGRCDFIKMDIEGSERGAVVGARRLLERDRPCLSIAVYHAPLTYCEIASDLRVGGTGYATRAKGLVHGLDGIWRPLMLHAWHPQRATNSSRQPAPAAGSGVCT